MRIEAKQMTWEVSEQCRDIFEKNFAETGQFREEEDVNLAFQMIIDVDDEFVIFIIYNDDDIIVGVSMFYISQHTQLQHLMVADQITFFIEKGYRQYALSLLNATERYFKKHKVDIIQQGAIVGTKFGKLLSLKGYKPSVTMYAKRLM